MGSKQEHIYLAADEKYDKEKVLMIGDAPGDMKAARGNDAKFFPVNPGYEEISWEKFYTEGADKFKAGSYDNNYEHRLIIEFEELLPELPPWKK